VVTARSVHTLLRLLLVTVSVTPASTGGNGGETDNGVSIQQSSSAVAGGINAKTDDSARDSKSVETGNSTDVTNDNPISGASPEEFSRILGKDILVHRKTMDIVAFRQFKHI